VVVLLPTPARVRRSAHAVKSNISTSRASVWLILAWLVSRALGDRLDESWVYPLLVMGYVGIWLLLKPASAFVRRHFERDADRVSFHLLGNVPTSVGRQVHATKFANLKPSTIQLLFADHPPPAERLELIERQIPTL
jgi:Zn-dependent protease with chaperone function